MLFAIKETTLIKLFPMLLLGDTNTLPGDDTDGNRTLSDGEGDTSRADTDVTTASSKKKEKRSGLRTPSFLKKKSKDKKK